MEARERRQAMTKNHKPEQAASAGEFAPADDVFAALESIPGLQDNHAEREAARDQMERAHKMGLSMIRKAAELTQTEVASRLGVQQTSVSRLEARPDMLMSTLRNYLDAAGAEHPRIVVTIAGVDYEVELEAFA
jgi:DNA-binding XRE family transcriptional regulator